MKHHRLTTSKCPVCGYAMDATTGITGQKGPGPGDVALCFRCGEVLLFADDLSMRQPDPMELLRYQLSAVWKQVQAAQREIRRSRGRGKETRR